MEVFARRNDHGVLIACSDDDENTEYEVIRNLHAHRVDGLIIASVMKKERVAREVGGLNIPVVYIDRRIESDNVSWVASDNYQGAYDLVDHMCKQHALEICYLGGLENISTSKNRLKGWRDALVDNDAPHHPELVFQKDYSIASGYDLAEKMYARLNRAPRAFFTASLTLLEGALNFITEREGGVPDFMNIGTYDDHPFLDYMSVKICSVRQDTRRLARAAATMIFDALEGKPSVQHRVIKPSLIVRS